MSSKPLEGDFEGRHIETDPLSGGLETKKGCVLGKIEALGDWVVLTCSAEGLFLTKLKVFLGERKSFRVDRDGGHLLPFSRHIMTQLVDASVLNKLHAELRCEVSPGLIDPALQRAIWDPPGVRYYHYNSSWRTQLVGIVCCVLLFVATSTLVAYQGWNGAGAWIFLKGFGMPRESSSANAVL